MTEDEAKTKWCPFVRIRGNDTAYNRMWDEKLIPPQSHCIASACMAWRWDRVANPKWTGGNMAQFPPPNPYSAEPSSIPSDTHGHCGLAGPQ